MAMSRKPWDNVLLLFFSIHLVAAITVDLVPLYMDFMPVPFILKFREFYLRVFQDPLMRDPPLFMQSFLWCEAIFQVPFFVYAISALLNDCKRRHLPFLVYSTHSATTILPCLTEIFHSNEITLENKVYLTAFYGMFLVMTLALMKYSYREVRASLRIKTD